MKIKKLKGKTHFYYLFEFEGKRRYINTGETVQWKAERIAPQKRAEWIESFKAQAKLSFEQIEQWDYMRYSSDREDTKHWQAHGALHWKHLRAHFPDPTLVTYDSVEAYILKRKGEKRPDGSPAWTNATLKKHIITLKRGLIIARDNKGFDSVVLPKTWPKLTVQGHVKGKRGASNDYSVSQIAAMIRLLQGHAQDEAIIAACTGLRAGELKAVSREHIQTVSHIEGLAATLYVPPGHNDRPRTIGIPSPLYPILMRALPLGIDHKRIYHRVCEAVTGSPKFGLRDFRAAFITALATIDPYGAHIAAGHSSGVAGRYHNWSEDRMKNVAVAAWQAFMGGGLGDQVGDGMGDQGYERKRLKIKNGLYCVK